MKNPRSSKTSNTVEIKRLISASVNRRQRLSPKAVKSIRPYDILCGRDKAAFNHVGNRRFRVTINLNLPQYVQAHTKSDKSAMIISLVRFLRNEVGVRFLKKVGKSYFELDEIQSRSKVGRALRDMLVAQEEVSRRKSKKQCPETPEASNNHPWETAKQREEEDNDQHMYSVDANHSLNSLERKDTERYDNSTLSAIERNVNNDLVTEKTLRWDVMRSKDHTTQQQQRENDADYSYNSITASVVTANQSEGACVGRRKQQYLYTDDDDDHSFYVPPAAGHPGLIETTRNGEKSNEFGWTSQNDSDRETTAYVDDDDDDDHSFYQPPPLLKPLRSSVEMDESFDSFLETLNYQEDAPRTEDPSSRSTAIQTVLRHVPSGQSSTTPTFHTLDDDDISLDGGSLDSCSILSATTTPSITTTPTTNDNQPENLLPTTTRENGPRHSLVLCDEPSLVGQPHLRYMPSQQSFLGIKRPIKYYYSIISRKRQNAERAKC